MAISLKALRDRFQREPGPVAGARLVPFPPRADAAERPLLPWRNGVGDYRELAVRFEEDLGVLWCRFRHLDRPSYTLPLLHEMRDLQRRLQAASNCAAGDRSGMPRYLVWASAVPGVWNLGGDLSLFARLIRGHDADRLRRYAHLCVDTLHANWTSLDLPLVTVALIQGDALGGGFEAALSDDLIVAEKGCHLGLPEILFNLFPGMGAFSFLSRRIGVAPARRMILSGRLYGVEELHELGLVDVLAEPGQGEAALRDYLARHDRRHGVQLALRRVSERCHPVTHAELQEVTDLWVDTAMQLSEQDLRKMDRLARAQERRTRAVAS